MQRLRTVLMTGLLAMLSLLPMALSPQSALKHKNRSPSW